MKHCWLAPLGILMAATALLRGEPPVPPVLPVSPVLPVQDAPGSQPFLVPATEQVGYILMPFVDADGEWRPRAEPYYPRAGDMVFYDDNNRFHHCVFKVAGTGPPTHSAIVFEACDGKPQFLELTGSTYAGAKVVVMDLGPRMFHYKGAIQVRQTHCPLSPEQNADLAAFAYEQDGKCFALPRCMLQATPFRCRSGWRRDCFGHTYLDRKRWICSELVVSGLCVAGLLDPHEYKANTIYPRDLAYDETIDLSHIYQPTVPWLPELPAEDH